MKITFIMPCVGRKPSGKYPVSWLMEPTAIAVLSALTPGDVERAFVDDRFEAIRHDEPTDAVALCVETYTARRAYEIAAEYRSRGVPVVMGGFHATLAPDEVAGHADAVVIGEAERVWPTLVDDLGRGRLQPRYAADQRSDLAGLRPDRSVFAGKRYTKLALVETARGCRHACDFCSISSFFERSYAARPIHDVVEEVSRLPHRNIFFIDDHIAVDPVRAKALFRALIPLRIRWAGQVGISVVQDDELLQLMRASGCVGVLIGFESLNPAVLTAMHKHANSAEGDYGPALRRLRGHGIAVYGTFVFGYDGDTEESFAETLEFALHHRLFFAAFNHLVPFPGTPVYRRLREEGRLLHDAWWLSPSCRFGDVVFRPKNMSAERLAALCHEYRHRFYSLPSVLRRGLDVKANCRTPTMALIYAAQNLRSGAEVDRRQGLPLGAGGTDVELSPLQPSVEGADRP